MLHELRTRKMAHQALVDAHVMVDPRISVSEGHFIAESARRAVLKKHSVLDVLVQGTVVQFSGKEAISQPFDFDVTLSTIDKNLNLALAVGQPIAIPVAPGRLVAGMIERIEQIDGPGAQGLYRLQIVPSAARLKYRIASRTFYGKTVNEVAIQVLNEAGVGNVEMRVAATLPVEEMIVQYQESDFAFVSRLLESVGLHYRAARAGVLHVGPIEETFEKAKQLQ